MEKKGEKWMEHLEKRCTTVEKEGENEKTANLPKDGKAQFSKKATEKRRIP